MTIAAGTLVLHRGLESDLPRGGDDNTFRLMFAIIIRGQSSESGLESGGEVKSGFIHSTTGVGTEKRDRSASARQRIVSTAKAPH